MSPYCFVLTLLASVRQAIGVVTQVSYSLFQFPIASLSVPYTQEQSKKLRRFPNSISPEKQAPTGKSQRHMGCHSIDAARP